MTINQIQDEILQEFSMFDDWMDKYAYIIELGNNLPPMPNKFKTNENLVEGCQSRLWIAIEQTQDKLYIYADSDAIITKGIASLLIRVFNSQTAQDIVEADLYIVDQLGLQQHLSPTRANGLASMIRKIRFQAIAILMPNEKN